MKHTCAILLAGGTGSRMGSKTPKQYLPLDGKPMALHSFAVLASSKMIGSIVIVAAEEYRHLFPKVDKPVVFAMPGLTRQQSVENGFNAASEAADFFCIHDSARPFITLDLVDSVCVSAFTYGAAALGCRVKQTIKEVGADGLVKKTLNRECLWEIQTPQVIRNDLLQAGFDKANERNQIVTDDVSLAELVGHPVKIVESSYSNIKITTPEDLEYAARS